MTSKHPLRRSCAFCRARKIKCSNEIICEACRKQGADCIYDFEPSRSKVRNLSFDNGKTNNLLQVRSEVELPDSKRRRSCSANSTSSMSPGGAHEELTPLGDGVESLAAALEHMFQDKFSKLVFRDTGRAQPQLSNNETLCTGLLPLMAFDLVAFVGQRYSDLGHSLSNDPNNHMVSSGLSNDSTTTMFDSTTSYCNPLSSLSHRHRNQLIDVWFSTHPLTFLLSKTLLLQEIREDTCDEILMAVMLADASFVVGEDLAAARGHELLLWAKTQLQMRPSYHPSEDNDTAYSGVPTRVYKGVTTTQTLVLLAWNALSSQEFRRAICYIEIASQLVAEIKDAMAKDVSPPNSSRINGVDVLDVEKEIVSNLWWTIFSLNLWSSIQTGVMPATTPSTFGLDSLPAQETLSVSIQLDLVSENLNTLQKQKSNIREMWPVAHLVNTVAYLISCVSDQTMSKHGVDICKEAIRLLDKSKLKDSKSNDHMGDDSRHLLVTFHQIMIIHLLFPKYGSFYDQVVVPAEIVHQFSSAVEQIIHSFSPAKGHPSHHKISTSPFRQPLSKALCTLLETCSRAFELIRRNLGLGLDQSYFPHEWDERLCSLANALYTLSQDERLYQGAALRSVKKQLKSCAETFVSQNTSNASGLLDPGMASMRSMSHSPQGPVTASNGFVTNEDLAILHSPFQCTEAASTISSSMPSSSGSSTSVSTQPFTPFEDISKWPISEAFSYGIVSTSHINSPPIVSQGAHNGASIQNMWYSQPSSVMNFETAGPVSVPPPQWIWPTTHADDATYLSFQSLDMDET
ncbi:hypothetical protein FHETE_10682 [Fusarium heterosporum]|uniref:Zn(2)-C6 fungal-type domain-containing protein n=1 Tax=Fusarium heterosporum TaxID=42747 RepID=A0A8H5SNP0_FUSHE|nr:hypothetical protein FHETE_10682 [Fusarium heterosporum]